MIESKKNNDTDIKKSISYSLSSIYNQLYNYKNITSPIIQFKPSKEINEFKENIEFKRQILVSPERSPIIQLKPSKEINEFKENIEFKRQILVSPERSPIIQVNSCKNLNRCIPLVIRPMPSCELSPIVQISSYKKIKNDIKKKL